MKGCDLAQGGGARDAVTSNSYVTNIKPGTHTLRTLEPIAGLPSLVSHLRMPVFLAAQLRKFFLILSRMALR